MMTLTAHTVVPDAAAASGWYAKAFGAREQSRIPLPGGKVMTMELRFGESVLHVASEFTEIGSFRR
jgi:PhnB protein